MLDEKELDRRPIVRSNAASATPPSSTPSAISSELSAGRIAVNPLGGRSTLSVISDAGEVDWYPSESNTVTWTDAVPSFSMFRKSQSSGENGACSF